VPLFTRLGLPDDCTFSFDVNPDPKIYTEVKAKPDPTPKKSDQAEAPAETKDEA
jgi:hypothetical protein